MRLGGGLMQVELTSEQIGVLTGNHRCRDRDDTRLERLLERGLELTVGMGRERNGLPIEFQIDLCVLDRTVAAISGTLAFL